MQTPMENLSCETEIRLVDAIRQNPRTRSGFVELAKFLETAGMLEESQCVYRGILPQSIQQRHRLNSYPHGTSSTMESCERLGWYDAEQVLLKPPLNSDPKRNSVFLEENIRTAPEYIDLMRDCTLLYDGRNRLYIDREGVRNAEHSTMNAYLLTPRATDCSRAIHLQGLCLLLAARNSHNFYHWHFDCLPALGLIEAAGIRLSDIDHVLLDQRDQGFQLQMLIAAGVRQEQIRFIDVENCHYRCDQMLMVRIQNQQGMAQSRRHLDWIRRTFLHAARESSHGESEHPKKIAIKREIRGFSNPKDSYAILEEKGYIGVQLETLPYLQQARLFAGATHVVAPHGAGLSLLVYSRPNTVVHEFHADHVQPCFWSLSSALGLRYHNYNCSEITDGETTRSNKNLSARLTRPITASAEQLSTLD